MTIEPSSVAAALAVLHDGLVIGLPTDTVYGIAADPMNRRAVEALYEIKGRDGEKPIPVLAASVADAAGFGMIDEHILERYWPGALTVVVRKMPAVPRWIGDDRRGTIALRVPDHPDTLALLARSGPLAVTSANRSGHPAATDDHGARAALGDAVAVYLPGSGTGGEASTIVDLTGREVVVIRPGPVAWES